MWRSARCVCRWKRPSRRADFSCRSSWAGRSASQRMQLPAACAVAGARLAGADGRAGYPGGFPRRSAGLARCAWLAAAIGAAIASVPAHADGGASAFAAELAALAAGLGAGARTFRPQHGGVELRGAIAVADARCGVRRWRIAACCRSRNCRADAAISVRRHQGVLRRGRPSRSVPAPSSRQLDAWFWRGTIGWALIDRAAHDGDGKRQQRDEDGWRAGFRTGPVLPGHVCHCERSEAISRAISCDFAREIASVRNDSVGRKAVTAGRYPGSATPIICPPPHAVPE